jgi:hypothetical protein
MFWATMLPSMHWPGIVSCLDPDIQTQKLHTGPFFGHNGAQWGDDGAEALPAELSTAAVAALLCSSP